MKTALQQIKSEIYAFDLRIGVVSHTLLAARVSANKQRRRGMVQKAKQRKQMSAMGGGSKRRGSNGGDDGSVLSDQE
jgi:hypothetical protein